MTAALPSKLVAGLAAGQNDRLQRPRLLNRLQSLLTAPTVAIWIGAGAGMGKSTLARQWLAAQDGDPAPRSRLLPLDETLTDGAGVLHRLAAPAGIEVPLWREQLAAPGCGLRPAWRALWSAWRDGAIVLDDLHRAGNDDALTGWLPTALEELARCAAAGPAPRLLLLSRRPPPPALARAQISGELTRLAACELDFDADERAAWCPSAGGAFGGWPAAMSVLARHTPVTRALSAPTVPATAGPDTALGSTAASAQVQVPAEWPVSPSGASADMAATGDDGLVQQLIRSEVLPELNARERQLLERLAWWPGAVDAAAALALGGDADAVQRLDALVDRGLLVDRVPKHGALVARQWVVNELLARALRGADGSPSQHWRATAALLETRGDVDAALATVRRAAAEGASAAWPEAARLVAAVAPQWLAACRHRALAEAAAAVPPPARSAAAWAALASALAAFDPRGGRDAALQALAALDAGPAAADAAAADRIRLATLSQIVASYFQTFDSTEPLAPWLARLEAVAPAAAPGDSDARAALAIGAFSALFLRTPHDRALADWQARVRPLPAAPIDPNLRLRAAMLLAKQAWYTAAHAEVALLPERARSALDDPRCTPYARLLWGLTLQYRAWAQGDPAAGRTATAAALAVAQASGVHGLDRHLHLHDACFARLLGDPAAARAQFAAAIAGVDATRRMEAWHAHSVQAWLALEDGELAVADAAVQAAIEAADAMGPAPQAMSWLIAGQIALQRSGAPQAAGAAIEALRLAARRDGNARAAFGAHWLEAAAALRRDEREAALVPLAAALAAMRQAGSGCWFGLHRAVAAQLAALALSAGVQPEAARALVLQHRLAPPPQADVRWPWDVRLAAGRAGTGELTIEVNGAPVDLGAKVPRRPLELLQALIEAGGRAPATRLADRLWPEAEGDRAMDAFEVALRRARALLGHADALTLAGGVLAFNTARVWVDAAHPRSPMFATLPQVQELAR